MKDKYSKILFLYGIITLLLLLEKYKEDENYEECKLIIDCIDSKKSIGIYLPKHIDEETIMIVKRTYRKFGLTGINVIENSKYYAEKIYNNANL